MKPPSAGRSSSLNRMNRKRGDILEQAILSVVVTFGNTYFLGIAQGILLFGPGLSKRIVVFGFYLLLRYFW
jgi:hypothetical protein